MLLITVLSVVFVDYFSGVDKLEGFFSLHTDDNINCRAPTLKRLANLANINWVCKSNLKITFFMYFIIFSLTKRPVKTI